MQGALNPDDCISCCFSSSRLKMISLRGVAVFTRISANFLPNDPVPPVTRMDKFFMVIPPMVAHSNLCVYGLSLPLQCFLNSHHVSRSNPSSALRYPCLTRLSSGWFFAYSAP